MDDNDSDDKSNDSDRADSPKHKKVIIKIPKSKVIKNNKDILNYKKKIEESENTVVQLNNELFKIRILKEKLDDEINELKNEFEKEKNTLQKEQNKLKNKNLDLEKIQAENEEKFNNYNDEIDNLRNNYNNLA